MVSIIYIQSYLRILFLLAYEKNPYTFFVICEHETFKDVIQHTDKIQTPTIEGSIEDAFLFYDSKFDNKFYIIN